MARRCRLTCRMCGASGQDNGIVVEFCCGSFYNGFLKVFHQSRRCMAELRVKALEAAAKALLDNPYPHDLLRIRLRVNDDYGGDEAAAKAGMESWCSDGFFQERLAAHRKSREELERMVKHDNGDK